MSSYAAGPTPFDKLRANGTPHPNPLPQGARGQVRPFALLRVTMKTSGLAGGALVAGDDGEEGQHHPRDAPLLLVVLPVFRLLVGVLLLACRGRLGFRVSRRCGHFHLRLSRSWCGRRADGTGSQEGRCGQRHDKDENSTFPLRNHGTHSFRAELMLHACLLECANYRPFARGTYLYEIKGDGVEDSQSMTGGTCVRNPIREGFCVQE